MTPRNGQAYTWDDNGNLVNDGAKTYTYDQANRLKAINGNGVTITYAYNGEGARLKQIVNGAVTISGGVVLRSHTLKSNNRAWQAFRQAAESVARSDNAFGAYYLTPARQIRSPGGECRDHSQDRTGGVLHAQISRTLRSDQGRGGRGPTP